MRKLQTYLLLLVLSLNTSAYAQNLDSTRNGWGKGKLGVFYKRNFNGTSSYKRAEKFPDRLSFPFEDNDYKMVFQDNFDSLDLKKWQLGQPWGRFHGQQPHQYYGDSEVFVNNGILHLQNRYAPKTHRYNDSDIVIPYGTGMINSYYSMDFQYGYFAVRSKNPKGDATWPAFWLTGKYNWPPEIDIFEMYARCDGRSIHTQTMSVHLGKIETRTKTFITKAVDLSKDTDSVFHIYSCLWEPCKISFYTDGVMIATIRLNSWMKQFYREPMFLLLNNAVDHRYLKCLDNKDLPNDFQVDWVQVYQKTGNLRLK